MNSDRGILSYLHDKAEIRKKPLSFPPKPEGTEWSNPKGVTADDVGAEHRMLITSEVRSENRLSCDCWCMVNGSREWIAGYDGNSKENTYRVPISTPFPDGSYLKDGKLVKPWVPKFKVGDRVKKFDVVGEVIEVTEGHGGGPYRVKWNNGATLREWEVSLEPYVWPLTRHILGFRPLRDGEEWILSEQWEEGMLLDGERPFIKGELIQEGDLGINSFSGKFVNLSCTGKDSDDHLAKTRRPLPEPPKLVPWDDTSDFPKVPTIWIRSKNDYRDHMVIGFANPCAIITASCGCQPVLESIHLTQDGFKDMEWSEDRKDWQPCSKTA